MQDTDVGLHWQEKIFESEEDKKDKNFQVLFSPFRNAWIGGYSAGPHLVSESFKGKASRQIRSLRGTGAMVTFIHFPLTALKLPGGLDKGLLLLRETWPTVPLLAASATHRQHFYHVSI